LIASNYLGRTYYNSKEPHIHVYYTSYFLQNYLTEPLAVINELSSSLLKTPTIYSPVPEESAAHTYT
jgi:hypothetical protein